MSISNTTENDILNLVFQAQTWTNFAQNAVTAPETAIKVCLHTADPGDTGTTATNAATYSSYAATSVSRATGAAGWGSASTGGSISPGANIDFVTSTAGTSNLLSYFSTAGTAGNILWSGLISPTVATGTGGGVIVRLTTTTTITLD